MRSRSENVLRGIEYMNWYQVIRPIGFSINEKSRVEILKVADESDLRLRDNIPRGLRENLHGSRMIQETELQQLASYHSHQQIEPNSGVPTALNLTKRQDTKTYLAPRVKDFQDQEKEIEEIFWELLKSIHPICPDDIDLQAIRKALAERQAKLGRETKEPFEEELFDKYGLGLNHRRNHDENVDSTKQLRPSRNELFEMIDRMATERMKPEPQRKDIYDKNNPIKGKVGFRRDETGQDPRVYTDLDDVLSFGDLDRDVDFQKYLVDRKRGRYDSKGTFISGMYDSEGNFIPGRYDSKRNFIPGRIDDKGNFIPGIYDGDGNFIPGKYDAKGNFVPGKVDSTGRFIPGRSKDGGDTEDDALLDGKRKSRKKGKKKKGERDAESLATSGKSNKLKSLAGMTEAERQKYLANLRKAKRHPETDFPMCNYPKWVHRMYRMDQVKIGQLIKQGMDVPEYTPPWILGTLDRVWGNKDPKSRGEKPSNDPKQGRSQFMESGHSRKGGTKGKTVGSGKDDELGKKESRKGAKGDDENQGKGSWEGHGGAGGMRGNGDVHDKEGNYGQDGLGGQTGEEGAKGDGYRTDKGLTEGLDGLADFLQGYEKEMVDLARLEAGSGRDKEGRKERGYKSFDMDDLIEQYHNELLREENVHKQDKERFHKKSLMEEKARNIKERQEAALKRIHNKEKKLKQEEEIKKRLKSEKDLKLEERRKKLQRKKYQGLDLGEGLFDHTKGHGKGKGKKGKGRDLTDKKTFQAETKPCAKFKASGLAKEIDYECKKRFQILLGGNKSRFLGGTDFLELAKQIELFKYPPAPPKKTPCERAKYPICA